jgi:hypothetical protein
MSHVDIGSFQGLHPRAGRAVYVSSKAAGIDLAATLHAGHEAGRFIYVAPGPVDTFMLHHNHWVVKAGGPDDVLRDIKRGDRDRYRAIFVDCSESVFRDALIEQGRLSDDLVECFAKYRKKRKDAEADELGVLSAEECAGFLSQIVQDTHRYPSGVYLSFRSHGNFMTPYIPFEEMDRLKMASSSWGA